MLPLMELFTIGYEGRTLPQLVRILKEHGITRLVDVRLRPASRKRGFSALALFESLRRSGITYESDRLLGNPDEIRELWKNGSLGEGKRQYRKLIRNGRRTRVEVLVALSAAERLCVLCYEEDPELCHRTIIAEEAARLAPDLVIRAL
jgi:uncharacterized protein (DUF488 family)